MKKLYIYNYSRNRFAQCDGIRENASGKRSNTPAQFYDWLFADSLLIGHKLRQRPPKCAQLRDVHGGDRIQCCLREHKHVYIKLCIKISIYFIYSYVSTSLDVTCFVRVCRTRCSQFILCSHVVYSVRINIIIIIIIIYICIPMHADVAQRRLLLYYLSAKHESFHVAGVATQRRRDVVQTRCNITRYTITRNTHSALGHVTCR